MQPSNDPSCPKCQTPIGADAPHGLCPKCVLEAVEKTGTEVRDAIGSHPSLDEVARFFPELEIIEVIGVGGMGVVYKARQTKLGRFVALKLLSAQLAKHSVFVERFNREGRVLAQLNHPHIVNIFDFGSRGEFLYLLMEFVDGVNLREAMQAETIAPADCLVLVQDICSALQFAHDQGVLHRDIKPENVLLDQHGRVKLADFGIAKLVSSEARENISLTNQHAVLGTLHYMAPEQLETPRSVDHRADIYSLGVVFYELLTGELPIGRFPAPSDASKTDPRLDKVVLRALEKRRDLRYQTVEEVKTDVESLKPPNSGVQQGFTPEPTAHDSTQPIRSKTSSHSRYATLSASFTGVSLVLLVLLILVAFPFTLTYRHATESPPVIYFIMLAGIPVLLILANGILGTLFGLISLCKINSSQGPTRLVRALFGCLTWPILLVSGVAYLTYFAATPTQGSNAAQGSNTATERLERELNEWTNTASVFNEAPGARNGHPALTITTARNGRYWQGPTLKFRESLFSSPEIDSNLNGVRVERIPITMQYSGVCSMTHPMGANPRALRQDRDNEVFPTNVEGQLLPFEMEGSMDMDGMTGGTAELLLPATMWSNSSLVQQSDRWDGDSCFPIYTQSQLDQFIDRIPLELPVLNVATDLSPGDRSRLYPELTTLPNEEPLINQDPLLKLPNINFDTHFAMVMLNYGTLTSVPIVECVKYEERPASTPMEDWTNRVWIDVTMPALYYDESCADRMGTYRLVVIPNPGTYGSLNFRFSQSSKRKSKLIPQEADPDSEEHRNYQYRPRKWERGMNMTPLATEEVHEKRVGN